VSTAAARLERAIELQNAGKVSEAASLFRQNLAENPSDAAALYSLAVIALREGDPTQALQLAEAGSRVAPGFAGMWLAKGNALSALGRIREALAAFEQPLSSDPAHEEALINSGVMLRNLLRHKEALERFNRVLMSNPVNTTALGNAAILLTEFKESSQAIAMFERLLALRPDYDYGTGLLSYERLHVCDWTDFDALRENIFAGVAAGRRACKTLALMALTDSAEIQLCAARIFAAHMYPPARERLWRGERYRHDRIRIGYLSPDFREHPVGHLMAGVIEHHDRRRFETIAFSLGIDDGSRIRARMVAAFDRFIDVRETGTRPIAETIRALEVDILVDLAGYTSDSRVDVLSWRPAPVQASFLGYPGTLGTDYVDWIIADPRVIPAQHAMWFSEQVAWLPDAYLPTDSSIVIPAEAPTRADCGLPEDGFVFCSFSHAYKISPPVFGCWMRLLSAVPGSVLWLASRGPLAESNLRREADARGVDPSRIVFAGRVPRVEDHLARYRRADLFLDTHPYNAHTTCADALMAGLPVVTCMGEAFPSRVAGSILHAAGLPELATNSLEEYESLALQLARDAPRLGALRQKLAASRGESPLFDTAGFCRHLEAIYFTMWHRAQLGGQRDALA
jgi:predicted O-linked N-acetylglucosamine transferase (SPINDLY family)